MTEIEATSVPAAGEIIKSLSDRRSYKSIFEGRYSDPNHPEGFRVISITGDLNTETGLRDGTCVGSDRRSTEIDYTLPAMAGRSQDESDVIVIDFSPKGGPKDLKGTFEIDGIRWSDGNKWPKVSDSEFLE